jgi:hypothetical protein
MDSRCLSVTAVCLLLSACTTKAVQTQFDNRAVVSRSETQVWSDILGFFTSRNIQIQTIERDSGVIYAERASFDSELANCDVDPLLTPGPKCSVHERLRSAANASQTQVTVNTDFRKTGIHGARPLPLNCYSTGLLESEVLRAAGAPVRVVTSPAMSAPGP